MYTMKNIQGKTTFIQTCTSAVIMERGGDTFDAMLKGPDRDDLVAFIDASVSTSEGPRVETHEVSQGDKVYLTDRYGNTVLALCPPTLPSN